MAQSGGERRHTLENGANIAVIGGGPTGSFFSLFALKMARMIDKEINITIYDNKDFAKEGPGGCNRCGGIISELLVQTLAVEGINLPDSVVQRGIDSYRLHTTEGSVFIDTPTHEKTIATVYRGGGPKGMMVEDIESFDKYLLDLAVQEGAVHRPLKIDRVHKRNQRAVLYSQKEVVQETDLVVGAFGVNCKTPPIFEDIGFGYDSPRIITAAIAEIGADRETLAECFGSSIHFFLLPVKEIKFAAIIPKGSYATLCVLGKEMNQRKMKDFLEHPVVKNVLPESDCYDLGCICLPKMNIGAPKISYADQIVICGDAGSTRLFKDGLGAAYIMGKAAAKTAVFHGVSKKDFRTNYYPVYKSIIVDNRFGKYLYAITDLYRKYKVMTKGMLAVVEDEQADPKNPKRLSSILWDMFTGNERYKKTFGTAVSLPMHLDLWKEFGKIISRRKT
jgi:flavin-dependent dehydrogenase